MTVDRGAIRRAWQALWDEEDRAMSADCGGAQEFTSRGAERPFGNAVIGLVRQALGCESTWRFHGPRATDKYGARGGTPNHRFLWRVWYYGWAMRAGSVDDKFSARGRLADFFVAQTTTEGHCWAEFLTTNHGQLWYLAAAGARLLALHHDDARIAELAGQWWRRDQWLDDLLTVEGEEHEFSPSGRGTESHFELRDAKNALVHGRALPRRLKTGKPIPATFWHDVYNVGVWILRELIRMGDDIGGITRGEREHVLLRDPLYVQRRGADFVYSVPHFTKSGPKVLAWTARIDGRRIDAPPHMRSAINWSCPVPPPALPGSDLTIVPGVGRTVAPLTSRRTT